MSESLETAQIGADEEVVEEHTCAKWVLRIVNLPLVLFGMAVLSVAGMMVHDETIDGDTLLPVMVTGAAFLGIGVLGLLSTKKIHSDCILKSYWLATFFGIVLTAWILAYTVFNADRIEQKLMVGAGERWSKIIESDLIKDHLDKIPRSCCGTKEEEDQGGRWTAFGSHDEDDATSYVCSDEVNFVTDIKVQAQHIEASIGDVPRPFSAKLSACMEGCSNSETCMGFYYQEANSMCGLIESDFDKDQTTMLEDEGDGRVCQNGSILGAGVELADYCNLGSPRDFEQTCWATIKDTIMANMKEVTICIGAAMFLLVVSICCIIKMRTLNKAIDDVQAVISIGMACVGVVLLSAGIAALVQLGTDSDALFVIVSVLVLGIVLSCLGVVFGIYSKTHPKASFCVYFVLFIIVAVIAFACIGLEDTVREKVKEKGVDFIDDFCDEACFAEIQGKMAESRDSSLECTDTPEGDEPCAADYEWASPMWEDPACNTTATLAPACECLCKQAEQKKQAATDAKEATKQYLVVQLTDQLNSLGWLCILVSLYILIEALCHLHAALTQSTDGEKEGEMQQLVGEESIKAEL